MLTLAVGVESGLWFCTGCIASFACLLYAVHSTLVVSCSSTFARNTSTWGVCTHTSFELAGSGACVSAVIAVWIFPMRLTSPVLLHDPSSGHSKIEMK